MEIRVIQSKLLVTKRIWFISLHYCDYFTIISVKEKSVLSRLLYREVFTSICNIELISLQIFTIEVPLEYFTLQIKNIFIHCYKFLF